MRIRGFAAWRAKRSPIAAPRRRCRQLIDLLGDKDRFVAFAARRALEKMPAKDWQDQVLSLKAPRPFLQGATGLLAQYPSKEVAQQILKRCEAMLRGDVNEPGKKTGRAERCELSRPAARGAAGLDSRKIAPTEVPTLTQQLLREYPTRDAMMNRELVKLLAYLQPPGAAHALAHQLETNIPDVEKLQIAAYAPRITTGWETHDKLLMLRYLETVRGDRGRSQLGGLHRILCPRLLCQFDAR